MHTDDDIFESLNIDESTELSGKVSDKPVSDAADDIFEDLDMENKIFETALIKDDKKTSQSKGAEGRTPKAIKNASGAARTKQPKVLNTVDSSVDRKKVKKEKEKKKKSKIKRVILCTIVELITLAAIFAYGYFLRSWNLIARPEVKLEVIENHNISLEKKKEMEGYWNIAVFGVDSRNSNVVERGLNSDVILIASINKDTGDIKLVSVFRDTYLSVSEKNSFNKINQAYAIGGPEQALAALNKNLDLNIQHYVTFNWKAVAEGINILGGVDNIPISKAELYYINAYITETVKVTKIGSYQLQHTGEQHLDGVQAVAYGRLRYMDNDFARTERQRNIIKASFNKAKNAGFSVLNNIMVVCFPQVATNIDFNDVIELAQNIGHYNIADTGGFPWSRGDANIGSKGACVIPTTLESNVIKLHEFLFGDQNYVPSDAVLALSNKIKSDSNLYKEGKFIESVATDGGVIQKPKVAAETSSTSDDGSKKEKVTLGVDEDGNYIYPTDRDGNLIVPTDSHGDVIYPTDEDGNIIRESLRPTELSGEDGTPGGHSPLSPGDEEDEDYSGGPGSVHSNTNPTKKDTTGNGNSPYSPISVDERVVTSPGGTSQSPSGDRTGGPVVSNSGPHAIGESDNTDGPGGSSSAPSGSSGTGSTAPGGSSSGSSAAPSGSSSGGAAPGDAAPSSPTGGTTPGSSSTGTSGTAPGGTSGASASPSGDTAPGGASPSDGTSAGPMVQDGP